MAGLICASLQQSGPEPCRGRQQAHRAEALLAVEAAGLRQPTARQNSTVSNSTVQLGRLGRQGIISGQGRGSQWPA